MSLRERIVRAVVAALAVGGTVTGAILTASQQEGVSLDVATEETRAAVVEATVALRILGLSEAQASAEVSAAVGAPLAEVAPVVGLAVGRDGRDPASLRSVPLAVAATFTEAGPAGLAWAEALCGPLALAPGLSARYSECLDTQDELTGASACANGAPVGVVVSMPATPGEAERLAAGLEGLASIAPTVEAVLAARGWTVCPEGG